MRGQGNSLHCRTAVPECSRGWLPKEHLPGKAETLLPWAQVGGPQPELWICSLGVVKTWVGLSTCYWCAPPSTEYSARLKVLRRKRPPRRRADREKRPMFCWEESRIWTRKKARWEQTRSAPSKVQGILFPASELRCRGLLAMGPMRRRDPSNPCLELDFWMNWAICFK